jgi:hypothetical protein
MRLHSVLAVSFDGVRLDFFLRGLGMSSALIHVDRGGRGVLHSFVCRNRAVLRLAKALGELPHGVDQFASSGGGNAKRPGSVTRHGEASANFDRLGHVDDCNAGPGVRRPDSRFLGRAWDALGRNDKTLKALLDLLDQNNLRRSQNREWSAHAYVVTPWPNFARRADVGVRPSMSLLSCSRWCCRSSCICSSCRFWS